MTKEINTEITKRIRQTDNEDLQAFLEEVLTYERKVLSQQRPHYKKQYRRVADKHMAEDEGEEA
jgi:hypothetical protein